MPGQSMQHGSSARDRLHPSSSTSLSRARQPDEAGGVEESNSFATNQLLRRESGLGGGAPREHGDAEERFLQEGGTVSPYPRLHEGGTLGKATHDFGRLGSMAKFFKAVGGLIDVLVPAGDELEVAFEAEVSVEGVCAGVSLSAHAGETLDGGRRVFELGGETGCSIGLGETGAELTVDLKCGIDATGDSSYECANLVGLALEQTVREKQFHRDDLVKPSFWLGLVQDVAASRGNVAMLLFYASERVAGDKIADILWGGSFDAFVLKDMDDDDEVSRSIGVGLNGQLEDQNHDELKGGLEFEHRDVYSQQGGDLVHGTENDLTISASGTVAVPPLKLTGAVSGVFPLDRDRGAGKLKASIKVKKDGMGAGVDLASLLRQGVRDLLLDLTKASDRLDATWVGTVIAGVLTALDDFGGMVAGSTGRTIGLTYDATSGDMVVTIVDVTKVSPDLDVQSEVVEASLDVSLEHAVYTSPPIHVGRL